MMKGTQPTSLRPNRGPQPADPGLVLGVPAEVAAAVCRSACLQVIGIAGLEFVCIFGYDGLRIVVTDQGRDLLARAEVALRSPVARGTALSAPYPRPSREKCIFDAMM